MNHCFVPVSLAITPLPSRTAAGSAVPTGSSGFFWLGSPSAAPRTATGSAVPTGSSGFFWLGSPSAAPRTATGSAVPTGSSGFFWLGSPSAAPRTSSHDPLHHPGQADVDESQEEREDHRDHQHDRRGVGELLPRRPVHLPELGQDFLDEFPCASQRAHRVLLLSPCLLGSR